MRSRYSAYVTRQIDYLKLTLTKEQQGDFSKEETANWADSSQWQGLEIQSVEAGGENDETGMVEFTVRFTTAGKQQIHYEKAEFVREDGAWRYSGMREEEGGSTFRRAEPKIGRNEPCPCGSGKKYKRCCGQAA